MKYYLLLSLVTVTLFAQCKKDNSLFDMPYLNDEMEIPPGIPPLPFQNIETPTPIITRSATVFEGYGYTAEDVKLITASGIRLDVLTAGTDFAFLERAFLLIRGEDGTEAEIGYLEFIPNNQGPSLNLIPSTTDVTDILKGTYFDVIFKMEPRYSPTQRIELRLNLEFNAFAEG